MDIYDSVTERLAALGFTVSEDMESEITYAVERAQARILADINHKEMPDGLYYVFTDMAVGLFLYDRYTSGRLGDDFDFDAPMKSITEGDVSVTLAGASDGAQTAESRFAALLETLKNPPSSVFAAFRKMRW